MHDAGADLPPLRPTPGSWGALVAADLPAFLRDHGACEQQAALTALSLVGSYPGDVDLCLRMTSLAAEEIVHLRKVLLLLGRRGLTLPGRRRNAWVAALHDAMDRRSAASLKVDRLLVAALIEARSCERFATARAHVSDPEVAALLDELGPAEARHWRTFHDLAARELPAGELEARWSAWLAREGALAARFGISPEVHG